MPPYPRSSRRRGGSRRERGNTLPFGVTTGRQNALELVDRMRAATAAKFGQGMPGGGGVGAGQGLGPGIIQGLTGGAGGPAFPIGDPPGPPIALPPPPIPPLDQGPTSPTLPSFPAPPTSPTLPEDPLFSPTPIGTPSWPRFRRTSGSFGVA